MRKKNKREKEKREKEVLKKRFFSKERERGKKKQRERKEFGETKMIIFQHRKKNKKHFFDQKKTKLFFPFFDFLFSNSKLKFFFQ